GALRRGAGAGPRLGLDRRRDDRRAGRRACARDRRARRGDRGARRPQAGRAGRARRLEQTAETRSHRPPRPGARGAIEALLRPRAIAVVGATERMQYGGRLVANLLGSGYAGQIVPINPNRSTVMGLPCYPSLAAAPCLVDLAAIVIPAAAVPAALPQC